MTETLNFQYQDRTQVTELASFPTTINRPAYDAPTSHAVPTAGHFIAQIKTAAIESDARGMTTAAASNGAVTISPTQHDFATNNVEQAARHPRVQPAIDNMPTAPVAALQSNPYDISATVSPAHAQALLMAFKGFPVFPLHSIVEGRCTCGGINVNPICTPGKHPHFWSRWIPLPPSRPGSICGSRNIPC